ncbi:hypothetical protein VMCG_09003 [Cytospora schulzeri]|uniref:Major facilitator superfamily (MFS) profile domain-containing protein n=1 Tax=Cytospora schulzeri TaxID=448051 RepID=A0A423VPP8_9PEZI|nr:hypothetical protein VMCG_09003 [Valsa malicola]
MAADERDERTPLLNNNDSGNGHHNGTIGSPITDSNGTANGKKKESWVTRVFGPPNTIKVLLAGFIITFSFSFTQVPIFYVFHLMECDVYYETHPPFTGPGDRCSINEIAAGTATQYSILGMSTTFCGTLNLFVTGWTVKKWGPRFALIIQTLIPGIRVLAQISGVVAGGKAGINIIQSTQLITILGGPAGYILVVNTIAGELVEPMKRTAVFGQLQGCIMLGQAISYLLGGMVGDAFGIRMPFQVAFFLFMFATLYAGTVLPYISPESLSDGKPDSKSKGIKGFLAPLRIMAPQRIRFLDGKVVKHYGVFFLCCGLFLGVLATGYAPLLLQMYATAYFDFDQSDNGWLMSGNALCRSAFLFFLFPRIIDAGRKWWVKKPMGSEPTPTQTKRRQSQRDDERPNTLSRISSRPEELEAPMGSGNQMSQEESMPQPAAKAEEDRAACRFDLFFLRWSLLVDGLLTAGAALCTQRWHVYLAAFLLPFGSGSAPAGKGVITEMCPQSQRTDALNAVTLVENIARLATQGLFGFIFSALAETGQAYFTFYINAAIAIVAMAVLYLSYFPPLDSTMVADLEGDDDDGENYVDENDLVRVTSHETDR